MATSGTTSYSVSELDIIRDALEGIGIASPGDPIKPHDYTFARRKLNMLVKQWTSQDFAPGLKTWCTKRGFLFLSSETSYDLGPTGDECAADEYVTSTTTVAQVATNTTVTLASVTGFATTMRIGVMLTTGAFHWTTINGAPVGLVVTLTNALPAGVAIGARVFCYAAKVQRPFEITSAVLHDTSGNDAPMDPNLSLVEYEAIPTKNATGTPSCFYVEPQRTVTTIYLDCRPTELTNVIRFTYMKYVDDFTATTDTVDFPAHWFRPLSAQLSMDCAPSYSRPITDELKLMRDESLKIAQHATPDTSDASYQADPDAY